MNFIELLMLTLINLLGFNTNKPADLHKKTGLMDKIEGFILRHATFFLTISIIILLALFVGLAFAVCGISATESGTLYNHFGDMV